jgi:lysyl-tRNA synthetase class 2
LASAEGTLAPGGFFSRLPYLRITVREAFVRHAGIDLALCPDAGALRAAAERIGIRVGRSPRYEDIFFHVFLQKVEKHLGRERPEFLIDYPACMASLARLKPGDPAVAERVELYANATELANGFSELTDAVEQRRRLEDEQDQRRSAGRATYPLDEKFLSAVSRMPEAAGVAVGVDRILMLILGLERIEDVLLFPAHDFQ